MAITFTIGRVSICLFNLRSQPAAAERTAWRKSIPRSRECRASIASAREQAILFIGSIREHLSIIALTDDEYADALQTASARDIVGGGIYDAMLAHYCAHEGPGGK
jgi:hypothetical protein